MCDDDTELDNAKYLNARLTRRAWNTGAVASVAAVGLAACTKSGEPTTTPEVAASAEPQLPEPEPAPTPAAALETASRRVTITTPEGEAEAFFVAPIEGKHPAVLIWPDVAGLRSAFETMATRLAAAGYAVLAVNCYYRSSKLPILTEFAQWRTEEGRAKIKPMAEALTPTGIARDATAFVAWLDTQAEVDTARKVGTTGYCMGGPFTFRTAAAVPERVGALGSFHGGGLVSEAPDSPHTLLASMQAAALVCVAQNDHERSPETQPALLAAAEAAGRTAEIEVYAANHGWTVTDSPVYDEAEAERAWARLLATFAAHL